MGIMYLTAPIIMGLCRLFGKWARWTSLLGLFIMCLSLALSSFSTTVPHLIATQGIFYAVGGGIAYCPCIVVSVDTLQSQSQRYDNNANVLTNIM